LHDCGVDLTGGKTWEVKRAISKLVHNIYLNRHLQGADESLAQPGRKQATATEDSYILVIIIIGGILVLYINNKTSIKRNILTIKQNTSGSRWG
jgi:hypothetical protein